MMREKVDVAVIGSGVIGTAAAWALGKRGVQALLLEQFQLGHDRGSSHGSTRIFRLSYSDPMYVRMAIKAREMWARLQDDAGEELLVVTGGLDAGLGASDCAAALNACAVDHAWLDAGELHDRFPGITVLPGERMLYQPDAGVCLAERAISAMQRLAQRDGISIRANTPVLSIHPLHDHVVLRTLEGEIQARKAVIAAGPWTEGLLLGAFPQVPRLTPTLQQVRYFAPDDLAGRRWPTFVDRPSADSIWYAVPMAGSAPGIKVASHIPGQAVDPRHGPFDEIDYALEAEASEYVQQRLPGLIPKGFATETCLYTMTSDEDFVLDREGAVVVSSGCSGHAFKFAPLIGEILADLTLAADPGVSHQRFSLSRPTLSAAPHI